MSTAKFIAFRLLQAIPLMIVATMLIFVAVSFAGDPLDQYRRPGVPQSTLDTIEAQLGLDKPLPLRYWDWITGALRGDLGETITGSPVSTELLGRSLVSLRLIAFAVILAIVIAIAVGFFSAVSRGTWVDKVLMIVTIILLTAPEFWTAVIVKQGAISAQNRLGVEGLPTVGDSTPGISAQPPMAQFSDMAAHLILPTFVLTLTAYPVWALYQRTAMLEVIDSDYVRLATAKGLPPLTVMLRHGLRNALVPVIQMIALRLPWIVGGLVVTETIFGWQGLGRMLVEGVQKQDVNIVLGFCLLVATLITVLNIAADLAHRLLDPRIRDV